MERIIIPTNYIHVRSTRSGPKKPHRNLSGKDIWIKAPVRAFILNCLLCRARLFTIPMRMKPAPNQQTPW